jgi:hypothetical protein
MKLKYLETEKEFQEWDDFLMKCPRGHFTQLSTWLKSFEAYSATFQIIIVEVERNIVGGIGLVIFGKVPFTLVTVPIGSIVSHGFENIAQNLIEESVLFSKKIGVFLFQFKIPYSQENHTDFLLHKITLSI